jgi:GTP cyclohydrolase II
MQTMPLSESIRQAASADLPTHWGRFRILGFERDFLESGWPRRETAVALILGDLKSKPPLVRLHSRCLTGDVFGSLRCDCGQQLELSLSMIAEEGAGVLIYEEQEGRGIGLIPKLQAYELQDLGRDTVEANEHLGFKTDYREFILAVEILKQLGVGRLRLLSNNLDKVEALERAGIAVVERVPCEGKPNPHAAPYLRTKKQKLRQLLTCL